MPKRVPAVAAKRDAQMEALRKELLAEIEAAHKKEAAEEEKRPAVPKERIPTIEEIRQVKDVAERSRLYAKRVRMLKEQRRREHHENVRIPLAQQKAAARAWRLRTYGSAWERARQAEARNLSGAHAASVMNQATGNSGRFYSRGGRVYDKRTGRRVR